MFDRDTHKRLPGPRSYSSPGPGLFRQVSVDQHQINTDRFQYFARYPKTRREIESESPGVDVSAAFAFRENQVLLKVHPVLRVSHLVLRDFSIVGAEIHRISLMFV